MFTVSRIIAYIEDKQLSDGGFFFAKVEPSSGADTYYAVRSLRLLGSEPSNITAIRKFWQTERKCGNISDLNSLYFYTQVARDLRLPIEKDEDFSHIITDALGSSRLFRRRHYTGIIPKDPLSDPSANSVYTDFLEGELRDLYYLHTLMQIYGIHDKEGKIPKFVLSLQNDDGGFGKIGGSQSATTFYALEILKGEGGLHPHGKINDYVRSDSHTVYYLEDLFWQMSCRKILHIPLPDRSYIIDFLNDCSRTDGGFSRSRNMGISTLEYTYYAVSLLTIFGGISNISHRGGHL